MDENNRRRERIRTVKLELINGKSAMDGCRRDLRIVGGHLKRGRKVGIRRGEIGSTLRKLMTSDSNGEKRRPCAGGTMNGAIDGRPSFLRICRGDFAHNSRWIQAKIPSLCPPIPYLIRSIPCHVFCLRIESLLKGGRVLFRSSTRA